MFLSTTLLTLTTWCCGQYHYSEQPWLRGWCTCRRGWRWLRGGLRDSVDIQPELRSSVGSAKNYFLLIFFACFFFSLIIFQNQNFDIQPELRSLVGSAKKYFLFIFSWKVTKFPSFFSLSLNFSKSKFAPLWGDAQMPKCPYSKTLEQETLRSF